MKTIEDTIKSLTILKEKGIILNELQVLEILKATKKISHEKNIINTLVHYQNVLSNESNKAIETLSQREKEIFKLIGESSKNKTIAKRLNISISTVETHRKNVIKKLKIKEHGKLIEYAILYNLSKYETIISS